MSRSYRQLAQRKAPLVVPPVTVKCAPVLRWQGTEGALPSHKTRTLGGTSTKVGSQGWGTCFDHGVSKAPRESTLTEPTWTIPGNKTAWHAPRLRRDMPGLAGDSTPKKVSQPTGGPDHMPSSQLAVGLMAERKQKTPPKKRQLR